jgi:uncharacterized protein YbjT (DUF2867 family)
MKVLVIGATGATGVHAVKMLLAAGHEVTAYARNPASVTEAHAKLRVAQGDARDAAALDAAVAGQDAVLCAFGPRSLEKSDVQEVLYRNLVASMKKHNVKRIVNLSAWGAGDSAKHMNLFFKVFSKTVLRHVWPDKERGERTLLDAGLDYVNVRPGRLVNEPARGGVKAGLAPGGMKSELTREDLARFMVDQLTSDAWLRRSPLVGY